jgi:hypothetical protein
MQAMSFLEDGGNISTYLTPALSTCGEGVIFLSSLLQIVEKGLGDEVFANSTSDYSKRFPTTQ